MMSSDTNNEIMKLEQRLIALETEKLVRACMNRYMALCDDLNVGMDLAPLVDLFTEDATWQGAGRRYAKTFGSHEGREAIGQMFAKYTDDPAHFALNAHFLCNEVIEVNGEQAVGSWRLIQPSTFSSGKSQLSCAKIDAEFSIQYGCCRISAFKTTNIFSRPMQESWDNAAPLAVPTDAKKRTSKEEKLS